MLNDTLTIALDPAAVKEMDLIVRHIEKGQYVHEQRSFHSLDDESDCGTAHCIAGWKIVRDAAKKVHKPIYKVAEQVSDNWFLNVLGLTIPGTTQWRYARDAWGLTEAEAACLFTADLSLEYIRETVNHFRAGERYVYNAEPCTEDYIWVKGEPYGGQDNSDVRRGDNPASEV